MKLYTRGKNITRGLFFLITTNRIAKYFSRRFPSSRSQKMSEDQTFQVQIIVPNLTNVLSNGIKQRLTS